MTDEYNGSIEIFEGKAEAINEKKNQLTYEDTKCGIGCFSPEWLQIFTSKKAFVAIYALAGMHTLIIGSYHVGTLSTLEKNFSMSSRMSGMISSATDIGGLLGVNLAVTYIAAKGHRTRWVALGMLIISIATFMRTLPYLLYEGGEKVKLYTKEYENQFDGENQQKNNLGNFTDMKYLHTNVNCEQSSSSFSDMLAFCTFFSANFLTGIGNSVYCSCGTAYLDDNVRKNIVPIFLAIVEAVQLLGPTIGFLISSYTLKIYINPTLTPIISNEDPRWIGAWWIGWYPIGIFGLICTFIMASFPKILPRAALRKIGDPSANKNDPLSFRDFGKSLNRILTNKIVMFNSLSSVSFVFGLVAFWTFMPKYLESQFRLSPSQSNFLTGTVSILSNGLGVVAAGSVISIFKPRPRFLAGWNVIVEALDVVGRFGYILLSCPEQTYHGHWNKEDNSWNLTEICNEKFNCGTDIQYAPVCDVSRDLVFYSSCHAGCTSSSTINNTLMYKDCSCVPGMDSVVVDGMCPVDCSMKIILLIAMMSILSFTSASGRSANTLIQFRSVEERDKSLSIGVTETMLAALAFTPAPILYGIIMDWTCIVWGDNCGSKGNCWIYNREKLRLRFNLTSAGFLIVGTILDCFVWYYAKELKMYDEDFFPSSENKKSPTHEVRVKKSVDDRELCLIKSNEIKDARSN